MKTSALLLLFSVTMLHAQLFRLTDTKNLSLQFKGKTVVAGERTALFPAGGFPEAQTLDETVGGARVHNAFGEKDGVKYRRELSLRGDELEVSVQIAIPPYTRPDLDGKPGYQLRIPLKTIAGARYTAITGRAYDTTEIRGRLAKGEYGALFQRSIRALYLSGDFGDLAIDCDPKGLNNHGDYGPNVVVGLWRVSIEGDDLVMGIFFRNASYGGECVAKAILFQGTFADHYRRHSHRAESYYGDLNPEKTMRLTIPAVFFLESGIQTICTGFIIGIVKIKHN